MKTIKRAIKKTSWSDKQGRSMAAIPTSSPSLLSSPPLSLFLQDLSVMERYVYEVYWNELDPFFIGKVSLYCIISFLNNCNLSDDQVQQVIILFHEQQEWQRQQVYALLRLVTHLKNGRNISKDLIYLPAPTLPLLADDYPVIYRSMSDPSSTNTNNTPIPMSSYSSAPPVSSERHSTDNDRKKKKKEKIKHIAHMPSFTSMLLMQSFAPPPSADHPVCDPFRNYNDINLRPNRQHQTPPPVPSQASKPPYLKFGPPSTLTVNSKEIVGLPSPLSTPENIFDTPPNIHQSSHSSGRRSRQHAR